jgi:hypothetical protein
MTDDGEFSIIKSQITWNKVSVKRSGLGDEEAEKPISVESGTAVKCKSERTDV